MLASSYKRCVQNCAPFPVAVYIQVHVPISVNVLGNNNSCTQNAVLTCTRYPHYLYPYQTTYIGTHTSYPYLYTKLVHVPTSGTRTGTCDRNAGWYSHLVWMWVYWVRVPEFCNPVGIATGRPTLTSYLSAKFWYMNGYEYEYQSQYPGTGTGTSMGLRYQYYGYKRKIWYPGTGTDICTWVQVWVRQFGYYNSADYYIVLSWTQSITKLPSIKYILSQ